jgi:hypothetical protein
MQQQAEEAERKRRKDAIMYGAGSKFSAIDGTYFPITQLTARCTVLQFVAAPAQIHRPLIAH